MTRFSPRRRRPPLVMLAVALAIAYAELAIQSAVLVENGPAAIAREAANSPANGGEAKGFAAFEQSRGAR